MSQTTAGQVSDDGTGDRFSQIRRGLSDVRTKIQEASVRANRPRGAVSLVAASKTVGIEELEMAIALGQTCFGENRVQEAKDKWPQLRARHFGIELHLIGPLQTNKARDAVALFDVIQSVDREKLARSVADECIKQGRGSKIYVQVNVGREVQKAGIDPDETVEFVSFCRHELGLSVVGLMAIPPVGLAPEPYFERLAELREKAGLHSLSIGMSGDFESAIGHGATHVRVGSAIFGSRPLLPRPIPSGSPAAVQT